MNKCLTLVHLITSWIERSPVIRLQPLANLPRRRLVGTDLYIAIWITVCRLSSRSVVFRFLRRRFWPPGRLVYPSSQNLD